MNSLLFQLESYLMLMHNMKFPRKEVLSDAHSISVNMGIILGFQFQSAALSKHVKTWSYGDCSYLLQNY